ncbi:MAG: hypothetical protein H6741_23385 [Alphaproteobacteria bacterium]|nr:hypothetical protein [Alphaproteobacteria bacterium]MCB9795652.1 hypothetical protein [Alphaproteobacteria bacterium]
MRLTAPLFLLAALLAPTAALAQEGGESSPAPAEAAAAPESSPEEAAPSEEEATPTEEEAAPTEERAAIEALDEPSAEETELAPLPDLEAEELSEEEAAALEALQAEVVEPEAPPAAEEGVDDSAATGWSYYDGRAAGEADARIAPNYMQHGIAGLVGGLVFCSCGCVGVTAAELLISPGVPQGPWQANDSSYQRGYIDGYRKTMQRRRALYALAGGTLGTAVAFGTGFAVGVYRGTPPFVNF